MKYYTVLPLLCAFNFLACFTLFFYLIILSPYLSLPYSSFTNQSSDLGEWEAMSPLGVSVLDTHSPFCGRVIQGQSVPEWPVCELGEHKSGQLWVCIVPACGMLPLNCLWARESSWVCLWHWLITEQWRGWVSLAKFPNHRPSSDGGFGRRQLVCYVITKKGLNA